jgi:hypothetical protein
LADHPLYLQAVLKQHITIDTGSSHPWKTAFTLQPFSMLVGLALFFILQRVIVVSRPHLRQARRAIEQVKEEARRVREVSCCPCAMCAAFLTDAPVRYTSQSHQIIQNLRRNQIPLRRNPR